MKIAVTVQPDAKVWVERVLKHADTRDVKMFEIIVSEKRPPFMRGGTVDEFVIELRPSLSGCDATARFPIRTAEGYWIFYTSVDKTSIYVWCWNSEHVNTELVWERT